MGIPQPLSASKHSVRKRGTERSPWLHFTNNARMACSHSALVRSSGPGLNAFCPALFL